VHHSPARFRMDPKEQLQAFNHMDEQGWELLAIYHSHPSGPPTPSATDIAEAAYPGVIHLIWSTFEEDWICKGFVIETSRVYEVPVYVVR
jgi:proteasome lid subunit RPN8/RPN11